MSKKDEALKLALGELHAGKVGNAMQILREALAEQPTQQEPVLCINPKVIDPATGKVRNGTGALTYSDEPCAGWSMPLYEHPPASKPWVGLTMNQLKSGSQIEEAKSSAALDLSKAFWAGARWAEAKLQEQNT